MDKCVIFYSGVFFYKKVKPFIKNKTLFIRCNDLDVYDRIWNKK